MKLIEQQPSRLFTFGCSFTDYAWPTWNDIVALDLNVPQYFNYGKVGAGNQFIANAVVQANIEHKFKHDDLIIICWTNVFRNDRWHNGKWITEGNISGQDKTLALDQLHRTNEFLIKDSAIMELTIGYLNNLPCVTRHLSMCDIPNTLNQVQQDLASIRWPNDKDNEFYNLIRKRFESVYLKLLPSFYNIIFDNKFDNLAKCQYQDTDDYHPQLKYHLEYLQKVFDEHKFSLSTLEKVETVNKIVQSKFTAIHETNDERKKGILINSLYNEIKRFVKREKINMI